MAGQRNAKYAATVGTQLLAKVHVLCEKVNQLDHRQDHPIDHLDEHINFVGEATDHIGKVVDELDNCIDAQDVQIDQLANMVNDLIVKSQAKEIKALKTSREEHCKVINQFTAKLIALDECGGCSEEGIPKGESRV